MTRKSNQRMKIFVKSLLSSGLALCSLLAQAELIVDTKYNGANKSFKQLTSGEKRGLDSFVERWEKNTRQAIGEDNNGIVPDDLPARESGHILWNGRHYYGWAVQYHSSAQVKEISAAISEKRKRDTLPGGGICALYVFDQDLNKLASLNIDLPENNHGTWCNGTYGFGGSSKGVNGVLITLSYYLAGEKPAQRAKDIGDGWRKMTVLIRFEELDGRLVLKQDDTCLGNPNTFDAIPDARKALARCAKTTAR